MARNSEKHFVGLNRVYLQEQWDKEKSLKRPSLYLLTTADDVRKWIPSINKDIEYCLSQLSGSRKHDYPETKLIEFEERVKFLEKEHKRFVKKVFELDATQQGIPWQPKKYLSKRKMNKPENENESPSDIKTGEPSKRKKIVLNVLKKDKQ